MLKVYINYPNPKISMHRDPSCGAIQKMSKSDQRLITINRTTISAELQRFGDKEYTFAANPAGNDMWLQIDFGDEEFESAVLRYVQNLIGKHYSPLAEAQIQQHC
jgi:hypothetical protein